MSNSPSLERGQARSPVDLRTSPQHAVLMYLVALLLSLPLFILLYPLVPEVSLPVGGGLRIDHALTFLIVFGVLVFLVRKFQLLVYVFLVLLLAAVTVTGVFGGYGVRDLYRDYAQFLYSLRTKAIKVPLAINEEPFHNAVALRAAMDVLDPTLRRFAVSAALTHFGDRVIEQDEYRLIQCFSVFREINSRWRYVSDPAGSEYFAKASESAGLLAGDCDDHAVLLAACIKAIGGEARLVRTTGHVYPELLIGDAKAMERAAYLIRKVLFTTDVGDAPLYYHIDPDGRHWINMDYTRPYPGGELMHEPIIGIMEV